MENSNKKSREKLLTSGQVAEICQVSVPTVLNWINNNLLSSYKTAGGHNRLSPLGLLRFLAHRNMFIPDDLYEMAGVDKESFQKDGRGEKPVAIVADDDETVRSLMRDVLESVDYVVVEVADGMNACLQMGLIRPDLLILDILMPEMDGIQVVQSIRKQAELDKCMIVVVSGELNDGVREKLEGCNVEHILQKPVPITEFIRLAGIAREAREANLKTGEEA